MGILRPTNHRPEKALWGHTLGEEKASQEGYQQGNVYAERTVKGAAPAHVAFMINRIIDLLEVFPVYSAFFPEDLLNEPHFVSGNHLWILPAGVIVMACVGTESTMGTYIQPHLKSGANFGL
jgi:hypothetical protein